LRLRLTVLALISVFKTAIVMWLAVLAFLSDLRFKPQLRMRLKVLALNAVFESAIVNAVCSFSICGYFAVAAFYLASTV